MPILVRLGRALAALAAGGTFCAIEAGVDDSYTARLRGGLAVPMSRRQSRKLRDNMGL